MDRRTLLKAGAMGAVTSLLSPGRAAEAATKNGGGLGGGQTGFRFRLTITGSFLLVFKKDGSAAEVNFLLPVEEEGCKVPLHEPKLMLGKGTSKDGREIWDAAGVTFEPSLLSTFAATDWNVVAEDKEHPTEETGWKSLKWLPMLLGGYDPKNLAARRSATVALTSGTLNGFIPGYVTARETIWALEDSKGKKATPWRQAMTDRILLTAMIGTDHVEIKRRILGTENKLTSLIIEPDRPGGVAELSLHNMATSPSVLESGKPLMHFCGAYQVLANPPDPAERILPRASGLKFDPVETEGPATDTLLLTARVDSKLRGNSDPPPLCDASRVIEP